MPLCWLLLQGKASLCRLKPHSCHGVYFNCSFKTHIIHCTLPPPPSPLFPHFALTPAIHTPADYPKNSCCASTMAHPSCPQSYHWTLQLQQQLQPFTHPDRHACSCFKGPDLWAQRLLFLSWHPPAGAGSRELEHPPSQKFVPSQVVVPGCCAVHKPDTSTS